MKKKVFGALLAALMVASSSIPVAAVTVYYNGTPVSWEYGRTWGVFSYSDVQSSVYEHGATANTTFSGWQKPGIKAHAQQFVGTGTAYAYWNCR